MKNKIALALATAGLVFSLSTVGTAFADDGHKQKGKEHRVRAQAQLNVTLPGVGQPVIGGTVSAVGSTTLSLTNKGSTTYTVNASGAAVFKGGATTTLSQIKVGDAVLVQGTFAGSSITASSIIDTGVFKKPSATSTATTTKEKHEDRGLHKGFMRGLINSFFHRLFGFF